MGDVAIGGVGALWVAAVTRRPHAWHAFLPALTLAPDVRSAALLTLAVAAANHALRRLGGATFLLTLALPLAATVTAKSSRAVRDPREGPDFGWYGGAPIAANATGGPAIAPPGYPAANARNACVAWTTTKAAAAVG